MFSSSLLDTTDHYIDTFRTKDDVEDIKVSVDRAKKAYGSDFGKIQKRKKGEIHRLYKGFLIHFC